MFRFFNLLMVGYGCLMASSPTPMAMASDLNLSAAQIKKLERIDATVEQVQRYSHAKRIEVLTPQQRKLYFSRKKLSCDTY